MILARAVALDVGTGFARVATRRRAGWRERRAPVSPRPLRGGVVVDVGAARRWLAPLLPPRWLRAKAVVGCPVGATASERAKLVQSCAAREVVVVDESRAAAIGARVDVGSRWARMVVDAGEGITEAAVFRDGRMLETLSLRIPLDDLRASEERVLRELDRFLRGLPHRVGCEVLESGIDLTGGGAGLPGFRERVESATGIAVRVAEDPVHAVIRGLRAILGAVGARRAYSEGTFPRRG